MKITLTTNEIANHLRQGQDASYSYNGSIALAEYLEELEECDGEQIELDVIAIRCDFTEYESLEELAKDYFSSELEEPHDLKEYFEENTTLIQFEGGIIIQDF